MKCFEVKESEVVTGISVATSEPYPRVILGAGGHKRATWIALGRRDAEAIVNKTLQPCQFRGHMGGWHRRRDQCEARCRECGQALEARRVENPSLAAVGIEAYDIFHPDAGDKVVDARVSEAGVIKLPAKEGKPEAYLIIASRPGNDPRVMVLWRVSSGYRGGASIKAGEGVMVIGCDDSWHSGRGNMGSTAEMLAILAPGQELHAERSGRRVQSTTAKLTYDGKTLKVTFGGEELDAATAEEVQGEYL